MSKEYTETASTINAGGRTFTVRELVPVFQECERERVLKAAKSQVLSILSNRGGVYDGNYTS